MGFFDGEVNNSLENMFDFNRDGYLDISERAMMFEVMEREEAEGDNGDGSDCQL